MGKAITKETITKNLFEFVSKHNRLPHSRELNSKNGLNDFLTIKKHFKTIKEYLEQVKKRVVLHVRNIDANKDSLVIDIIKYKEKYNQWPTFIDCENKKDLHSPYLYTRLCGSWSWALKQARAGFPTNKEIRKDKLAKELKKFSIENSDKVTRMDFDGIKLSTWTTYTSNFGTIKQAFESAGLVYKEEDLRKTEPKRIRVNDSWDGTPLLVPKYIYNQSPLERFFKNEENKRKFYEENRGKSSGLETFISRKLTGEDKYGKILNNSRDLLISDLEIDIYIKSVNLAIEVNGIFHYRKIFKSQALERTIISDFRKILECDELGINLLVIDSSDIKHMSVKECDRIWAQIIHHINNPQKYKYIKINKLVK